MVSTGGNPIEVWQNKIRHIRQYLRGWAKEIEWHLQSGEGTFTGSD
jgi:hypothetical protein